MKRIIFTLALLMGGGLLSPAGHAAEQVAIGSNLTIQVPDRDKTAAMTIGKAEALGGYFSTFSKETVTLKVPADKSGELISYVKANWKPVQESYRSEDVAPSLDQARARLKAKQELYAQFEKLLATANAADIIEVETAATKLIGEIEVLKGRLRALQHRIDFATVTINFRLLQRERPRDDGNTPFAWLNELGLENLMREFEQ